MSAEGQESEGIKKATKVVSGCLLALLVIALLGIFGGVMYFVLHLGSEVVAHVTVSETPASATFRLDAPKKLALWTDLEVTHDGFGVRSPNDSLPHVLDYAITVERDGARVADLRCNPFDSNVARTSGSKSPMGEPSSRSYDGLLNGCTLDGAPGTYVITVRREWRARDPRIVFQKTDLLVRAE